MVVVISLVSVVRRVVLFFILGYFYFLGVFISMIFWGVGGVLSSYGGLGEVGRFTVLELSG